jgi:2-polyprenyl-3-methyl-5-hydroxy-6-metoxy-1,4-benzoquinol methylase
VTSLRHDEQAADWDSVWRRDTPEFPDPGIEARGLRWKVQRDLVTERRGRIEGLRVIEIGAGRATNALLYALHGASATVLDRSPVALEQAATRFASHNLPVQTVEADAFELPPDLLGAYDVAMSFGLCEHFLGERRRKVVAAHISLIGRDGIAIVNVPNRLSPFYRAWMGLAKLRGSWTLGTEVPFSAREMCDLARRSGGSPLRPVYVGGLGTVVNHGINPMLRRLHRSELRVPQVQIPVVDLLAYDLLVPIVRAG